ncbi:Trk system potassium transporter TrkA [uncultured Dubosiella sp.]|uniref:Trk system potassium transporter TrkA n=1 Tax=uncultured Dubosiella sp. TaxID=1937011 RepID=UPI00263A84B7|nr:Trk system potassium transporter TrkA [uncultured Dubosiella sp.]
MEIVIIGDGKVRFAIAGQLDREGHNVTVIDSNQAVLDKTSNLLDVVGIYGNGATPQTLKEAGADHADLVIAATSKDEINILSCLLAKKMGARHTIARIRTPEYVDSLNYVKEELGLSLDINPELAAAREIRRSLRFTSEIHTSSLAKARLELAEIKVFDHSPLAGKTIMEISKAYKQSVLFCLIERDDDLIIPSGNTLVRANDKLVLTGRTKQLQSFFNELKILKNDPIKEVMIIGGGRITYYLTPMLSELGIAVTIIEKDAEKCLKLVESFPYATIIHGDGTDHELLMSENLEKMDGFVALTDNDEENVMVSMFAAAKGVSHVIPKVNRVELGFIFEKLGLRNAITPKNITANHIVSYVRAMQNSLGSNVESLLKIKDERIEILEFRVRQNCRLIGRPIMEIGFKPGILIAYVTHHGEPKVADGQTKVALGDTVIVISKRKGLSDINDILA